MGAVGVELLVEDQCTFVTRTHDGLLPLLNLPLFFLFLPSTPVPVNSSLHEPVWTGAASFFFCCRGSRAHADDQTGCGCGQGYINKHRKKMLVKFRNESQ